MRLTEVTVQYFKNFVEPQTIEIEADVTCFIGKNESGKTTILQAIHRVHPANGNEQKNRFDLTTEYPRWRLARDRRNNENIMDTKPVTLTFILDDEDRAALKDLVESELPEGAILRVSKTYANELKMVLQAPLDAVVQAAAEAAELSAEDASQLLQTAPTCSEAAALARRRAEELAGESALQSKAWTTLANRIDEWAYLVDGAEQDDVCDDILELVPKTFYFSNYQNLPGEADLTDLASKVQAGQALNEEEETIVALLQHAGERPEDFLDDNYDSRKAELQAASVDLTRHAFEYWRQNTDLEVVFDTDNVSVGQHPNGGHIMHRLLKIQLRDGRHGGVETNFSTRSSGFQWFFSFFAAFSAHQESEEPIIVLLDEPGTSLHGDAQRDFVRFIMRELGASKQTLYTTHSQHMVDPTRYEKLRGVHDRSTRENPDNGVSVTKVNLSADRDTILPVESALGYSVSQHLFLGSGQHLAVEGSSDFVYLQRFTEYLISHGQVGLDPRLSIIPVGSVDNMPVFIALLGRRLRVSALVDGDRSTKKLERILAAARDNEVNENAIVVCSDVGAHLPRNADVEDLFDTADYLRLYNWAFNSNLTPEDLPQTSEPIIRRVTICRGEFDHALPAHAFTHHRDEFFASVHDQTIKNFSKLFVLLNSTVTND
ncbi:AAA family ATPase [Alicyclobacillus cycloheptanicus]|uniref:ATP-dependent endonuclease of OLD family n=1 Tax=Alicyclobacillus cycloheptanicus TaxID=1457 RepID=A0ABT9XLR0_9BACL|nr:AAA family ATPase [Alicyclobacillus cycloheptanicus]MDQ0190651.1 putative ATP-dependent endonuclease of OLD family [Alicyclobacillus cycloheptanicus]WDM01849.1 AAA family ATPase [Alicyclobacillus cycloheptanicus]